MSRASPPPLTVRSLRRVEYERLVAAGAFHGEPLELIGGRLLVAEPKGSRHSVTVSVVAEVLRTALPAGWVVRSEQSLALDDDSEPEPDVAVVRGPHTRYLDRHPRRPALVVEVADASLDFDRTEKAGLYARGGVADYWIVNLVDRVVELYREPVPEIGARYGWRYASVTTVARPALVTPLAFPTVGIAVASLLP